jgi:hypothetical protein
LVITWQPSNGPMHDNAADPGDTTRPIVTTAGVYAFVGASGAEPTLFTNFHTSFFTFHVGATASAGATLDWLYHGRPTDIGTTTIMVDNQLIYVDATDNHLQVVPEPGTIAALVGGIICVSGWRRRR